MRINQILLIAANQISAALKKELRDQGHYLTGSLERSIVNREVITGDGYAVEGIANGYASILDTGTPAAKIPYNPGSGAKTSKYIQALFEYWKLRGLSEKEAMRAAFATAMKQKREGMPTFASRRFAKNKVREHFIQIAEINLKNAIDKIVIPGIDEIVSKKFNETKSEIV